MVIPPDSKGEATFLRPDRATSTIPTVVVRPTTRPTTITPIAGRSSSATTGMVRASSSGIGGFFPFAVAVVLGMVVGLGMVVRPLIR